MRGYQLRFSLVMTNEPLNKTIFDSDFSVGTDVDLY
jgi:hypothetical protein